jgi:hypothetical protein
MPVQTCNSQAIYGQKKTWNSYFWHFWHAISYYTFSVLDYYFFNIHGSVHRNNILLYKYQQDSHVTEFILSDNWSTCFGRYYHPSSEAQTTVTTAYGNRYTVLLSAAIVEELELIWMCCGWRTPCASCWDFIVEYYYYYYYYYYSSNIAYI